VNHDEGGGFLYVAGFSCAMKKHSSAMTHIGMMTALYGFLIMGAVFAASSISATSPVATLNGFYETLSLSLSGLSSFLVMLGALVLVIGLFMWRSSQE
jgi:hypothetical protein